MHLTQANTTAISSLSARLTSRLVNSLLQLAASTSLLLIAILLLDSTSLRELLQLSSHAPRLPSSKKSPAIRCPAKTHLTLASMMVISSHSVMILEP